MTQIQIRAMLIGRALVALLSGTSMGFSSAPPAAQEHVSSPPEAAGLNAEFADVVPEGSGAAVDDLGAVIVGSRSASLPPGTLGVTYYRFSHPVPVDKHPRTAMLAVRDRSIVPLMSVSGMSGFRMRSGVWLFESDRPLDPGVSHVVRVEARQAAQEVQPATSRFVRLIPGRIVYLDYWDRSELPASLQTVTEGGVKP